MFCFMSARRIISPSHLAETNACDDFFLTGFFVFLPQESSDSSNATVEDEDMKGESRKQLGEENNAVLKFKGKYGLRVFCVCAHVRLKVAL